MLYLGLFQPNEALFLDLSPSRTMHAFGAGTDIVKIIGVAQKIFSDVQARFFGHFLQFLGQKIDVFDFLGEKFWNFFQPL